MADKNNNCFNAAWWLRSPHLQTIWPVLFRRRPKLHTVSERIELPDGDFLDLSWPAEHRTAPIVLILHGLEGSLQSHYAGSTIKALCERGFSPIFMHFRGCSGMPNRLLRSYHSGDTADVDFVMRHIENKHRRPVEAVVGFSLGGNVLLKWLGEQAGHSRLKAAIAVSVPFELNHCAVRLEHGLSRIYQQHLVDRLKRSYKNKLSSLKAPLTINLNKIRTFREFDNAITAPINGFRDVDHYYSSSSSKQFLKAINTPTLLIQSEDDPFMLPETMPTAADLSDAITLERTSHGGHVGFVSGPHPFKAKYWLDDRITDYLSEQLLTNID